jgi:hypothetical protein
MTPGAFELDFELDAEFDSGIAFVGVVPCVWLCVCACETIWFCVEQDVKQNMLANMATTARRNELM